VHRQRLVDVPLLGQELAVVLDELGMLVADRAGRERSRAAAASSSRCR